MTERGLPNTDGAPACPFVAFEDDREERATSPDSRHRCYAEVRPAPRALAHQDAYCLTNAFGVCPTFQDWARRESARIRDGHGGAPAPSIRQAPPPPPTAVGPGDEPARRNPQRGWSAPPPWMGSFEDDPFAGRQGGGGGASGAAGGRGGSGPSRTAGSDYGTRRPDAGLAGSLAHRIAMDGQPPEGSARGGAAVPPSRPQREVVDPGPGGGIYGGGTRGGGAAPAGFGGSGGSGRAFEDDEPAWDEGDGEGYDAENDDDGRGEGGPGAGARERLGTLGASAGAALSRVGGLVPRGRPGAGGSGGAGGRGWRDGGDGRGGGRGDRRDDPGPRSQVSQRSRPTRRDPAAPPWERPVRYEAYPTLRTRMGVPTIPRALLIFLALLLAAGGLFFLPGLLGLGAPKASPTPLPVPSRSPGPTFSFAPSPTPGPTFVTYVVQAGDTMSKIAARFGVPLTMLIDANKDKYPNPDKIVAGDTLIIPSALPSAFKDATPSKSPGKSP